MKLKVETLIENPDGSADVSFIFDEEAKKYVFALGIEAAITIALETTRVTPIDSGDLDGTPITQEKV